MLELLLRERRRSRAVRDLIDHDLLAGQVFDRFVNAAAFAFDAPIAAVSLIHSKEQSIKAGLGFPLGCMPRANYFCSFTLDGPDVLECVDPQNDHRFSMLPVVRGKPYARYYIGAPLRLLSGLDVGTLCVVDTVCRKPASDDQKAYFIGLARQAAMMVQNRLDLWGHPA